jgi:hypothetical protein
MRRLSPQILCAIVLALAVLSLPQRTPAQKADYCPRITVPLANSFGDLPITIEEARFASFYETTGYVRFRNTSDKSIDAVSLQIEHSASVPAFKIPLSYETDVARKARSYSQKLSEPITPGKTISLVAASFGVVTSCPESAQLSYVRIRFSDGTSFQRHLSEWLEPPMPQAIRPLELPVGTLLNHDVGYLVRFGISATGKVTELEELDLNGMRSSLRSRLSKWLFHPETANGIARPGTLYAVVRVHMTHCEIQDCSVPFSKPELPGVFTFIDLVPTKSPPELQKFAVYYGGFPVSGNGDWSWY